MKKTFEDLYAYICGLEIIDTHEHLPFEEQARNQKADFFQEYLIHYFSCDLVSAGLPIPDLAQVRASDLAVEAKWDLVETAWEASRNTGYGRALDIAVRDLYGIEQGIRRETVMAVNEAFQKALKSGKHFNYVLKEKSNIKVSLLDSGLDCDRKYFRSVFRLDNFIVPGGRDEVRAVEKQNDLTIQNLGDWEEACRRRLEWALEKGAVALKCGLAYHRSLQYDRVSRTDAEDAFHKVMQTLDIQNWIPGSIREPLALQNHMMHFILKLAAERKLTFQFHTGIQEGNGNYIRNADPSLMSNLFIAYPEVKFDIFHMGYPYQQVLSVLAKNFANVFIDMSWAHVISPAACVDALAEWLDAVPANKISAFGGDYCFVDGVYGHQFLARENIARALTRKIKRGVFDLERAKEIAQMILYGNPLQIFQLEGKL
jgi:glucuronate isomerase